MPTATPLPAPAPAFRRVIAAVDGSDMTGPVLEWARFLATAPEAQLWLLHSMASPALVAQTGGGLAGPVPVADLVRYEEERGRAILTEAAEALAGSPVRPETLLLEGPAAAIIPTTAKDHDADLVIVGSHGRGAFGRLLLGSVADAARHRVPTNLLIARAPPPVERILAAVDGSPEGQRAALVAATLGNAWRTPVDLVHVRPITERGAAPDPALANGALGEARSLLEDPNVHFHIEYGDAAEALEAHARERDCGLIVMGSHGRGALGELVLGSTTAHVSHHTRSNLLIVREPETRQA